MRRSHWISAAVLWAVAALLAYLYRSELAAGTAGTALIVVLCFPPLVALYFLMHLLGEGAVLVVLVMAFKVVTLGRVRTELTVPGLSFPWHGFARAEDGTLVASENAMSLVAISAYAVVGLAIYFVFR